MVKNILKQRIRNYLTKAMSCFMVITLLVSCAGIPGKNVRLENYPEVKSNSNSDLGYEKLPFVEKLPDIKEKNFSDKIINNLSKKGVNNNKKAHCLIQFSSRNDIKDSSLLIPYAWVSMLTLMIIPYYVPLDYEAKATLISTKDNKILKEYYLKDKVHEVWSSLWMLSWFFVDSWAKGPTPEGATEIVEQTISEALTRQILNDASKFEECRKK